jgi:hypothetical protein
MCQEDKAADLEMLTGLRPRMNDDYRVKVFFPSMFRFIKSYTDNGTRIQEAFIELSKITGYKISYLKRTYYELLKREMQSVETIDENVNPLNDEI